LLSYDGNKIKPINSTIIDTVGTFKILKSDKLEKEIKKHLKTEYYLYGTKGYTKINIEEVFFTTDECISNLIAVKISKYDESEIGHPLFCSENQINVEFKNVYEEQNKLVNDYLNSEPVDYSNPKNSVKGYGNIGTNYFFFEDDFKWRKEKLESKINFPSRLIYKIDKNKKVEHIWSKSLDLFGIPCD
jgi:hypothetical protein